MIAPTLSLHAIAAFAAFDPETGIDLNSIGTDRAQTQAIVDLANAKVLNSHGMAPFECQAIIIDLAPTEDSAKRNT